MHQRLHFALVRGAGFHHDGLPRSLSAPRLAYASRISVLAFIYSPAGAGYTILFTGMRPPCPAGKSVRSGLRRPVPTINNAPSPRRCQRELYEKSTSLGVDPFEPRYCPVSRMNTVSRYLSLNALSPRSMSSRVRLAFGCWMTSGGLRVLLPWLGRDGRMFFINRIKMCANIRNLIYGRCGLNAAGGLKYRR